MSNLVVRTFAPAPGVEFLVRVVVLDGSPWFVRLDASRACGISDSASRDFGMAFRADGKGVRLTDTPGGPQKVALLSERGLYKLIELAYKPQARAFQDWVTRDVLPTIRRGALTLKKGMAQ